MKFDIKGMGRRGFMAMSAVAVGATVLSTAFSAQAATVEEIKKKGTITFGVVTDQPPFHFINASGQHEGYDYDISQMMAKELGVKVEYVPITSANRIPQLLTGKVDMLICVLGIYPDRAKVIQYVAPYASIIAAIYGPKDAPVKTLAELDGHSIAVEKGSSMDKSVTEAAPKGATIRRYDDASSTVQAFLSGQADYIGTFSHQFLSIEKSAPGKYGELVRLKEEFVGIAVAPQSKELGEWAGEFMAKHEKDGTLSEIYKKAFGTDFPKTPDAMEGITFTKK